VQVIEGSDGKKDREEVGRSTHSDSITAGVLESCIQPRVTRRADEEGSGGTVEDDRSSPSTHHTTILILVIIIISCCIFLILFIFVIISISLCPFLHLLHHRLHLTEGAGCGLFCCACGVRL
jgi:hypothetical protein